MKSFIIAASFLSLIVFSSCKEKDENVVTVTTEEVTKTDTIGPRVRTVTAVEETTETDTSEVTITTGGVEVESINADENK